MDTFDDTFDEAIEQLLTWGGVFTRVDTECVLDIYSSQCDVLTSCVEGISSLHTTPLISTGPVPSP